MKELLEIQSSLKAPKEQFNAFGKYKYRNCEDILEALKPLLTVHNCVLVLTDEVKNIGNRYYVEATAILTNAENVQVITKASAREEETKKGMDGSQITGSASSYARKYALSGLFCLDDNKDVDSKENKNEKSLKDQLSEQRVAVCNLLNTNSAWLFQILERYNISKIDDLTESQVIEAYEGFKKKGHIE